MHIEAEQEIKEILEPQAGEFITFADQAYPTAFSIAKGPKLEDIKDIGLGTLRVFSKEGKQVVWEGEITEALPRGFKAINIWAKENEANSQLLSLANKGLHAEFTPLTQSSKSDK